ncbi:C40 family peptidase [Georgenia sp. SYP-B2076]|uniref:C40 family peptidase n=1 Tax=Georgenia sp. SYP-B2076 TaxID=2495881 RepID=UPI002100DEC2|nr:C40 family peptidase [Georgenia sp. SYP-B2076]
MTSSTTMTGARHRVARRPSTPLTTFGQRLAGSNVRRGVAAVASSGLVLTMAATAAGATTNQAAAQPKADVSSVTAEAMTAMVTTPTVTVPATIEWSVEPVAAKATPAPEPEPAPVVERATRPAPAASRSNERAALATAATAAPATAAAPAAAPAAAAPASASASQIVNIARKYVGTPYVYGGTTPAGFDCSGFTAYVFAQAGINLPRTSSAQRAAGTVVSAAQARPGDLVWGPGHVGIYTGNGNHIAARSPGTGLHESPIYLKNPVFIRVA